MVVGGRVPGPTPNSFCAQMALGTGLRPPNITWTGEEEDHGRTKPVGWIAYVRTVPPGLVGGLKVAEY